MTPLRLCCVVLTIYLTIATSYVPTPKRQLGVLVGSPTADIQVQLVFDAQCDGSAQMNTIINEAKKLLGDTTQVSFRYYFISLPYHIMSFKMAMGLQFMLKTKNAQTAYDYIQYCLNNIDKWAEANNENVSLNSYQKAFADEVAKLFGVNATGFLRALKHSSDYDTLARINWKYLTGMKRVPGTPYAFINGVFQDAAQQWTAQQWVSNINSLL